MRSTIFSRMLRSGRNLKDFGKKRLLKYLADSIRQQWLLMSLVKQFLQNRVLLTQLSIFRGLCHGCRGWIPDKYSEP